MSFSKISEIQIFERICILTIFKDKKAAKQGIRKTTKLPTCSCRQNIMKIKHVKEKKKKRITRNHPLPPQPQNSDIILTDLTM